MKLGEFYKLIVKEAIRQDPRSPAEMAKYLNSVKEEYDRLPSPEKRTFDKERFSNPYSDTRILYGSENKNIKTVMIGIDIEAAELLLADKLNSKGKRINLVLAHHPEGYARTGISRVMNVMHDILKRYGVTGPKIKKMLDERINEVLRKVITGNCTRPADAARLLNIPFMCAHTVADNFVYQYFNNMIKKEKPKTISDIFDLLYRIPEYKIAMENNMGPKLILGKPSNKCGRILLEMTGGTEGPKGIYKYLAKNKVATIIGMHMSEEHFKKAKKSKLNVVIAGHMSSDTLGLNLLLDKIQKRHKLNIISCSGFNRICRI